MPFRRRFVLLLFVLVSAHTTAECAECGAAGSCTRQTRSGLALLQNKVIRQYMPPYLATPPVWTQYPNMVQPGFATDATYFASPTLLNDGIAMNSGLPGTWPLNSPSPMRSLSTFEALAAQTQATQAQAAESGSAPANLFAQLYQTAPVASPAVGAGNLGYQTAPVASPAVGAGGMNLLQNSVAMPASANVQLQGSHAAQLALLSQGEESAEILKLEKQRVSELEAKAAENTHNLDITKQALAEAERRAKAAEADASAARAREASAEEEMQRVRADAANSVRMATQLTQQMAKNEAEAKAALSAQADAAGKQLAAEADVAAQAEISRLLGYPTTQRVAAPQLGVRNR